MMHKLRFSQAVDGFMLYKRPELATSTLDGYQREYDRFLEFLDGDPYLADIRSEDAARFLDYLRTTPQKQGGVAPRKAKTLSRKSLLNVHTALSSLWTWATTEGFADEHIMRHVPRPRPEQRAVNPLTRDDVVALLAACDSYSYQRNGTTITAPRLTAARDKAIIMLLVDTGLRVSELCRARVGDLDQKNNRLKVFGKGAKERILQLSTRTTRALWLYLTTRDNPQPDDPLFTNHGECRRMKRRNVGELLSRIGKAAGVADCYPHRFRHTFAINFLVNGGNVYALKALLGHTSLQMCMRYLAIAEAQTEVAHKRASPVANWKL